MDARSLLKNPRDTGIVDLCGGSFVYFRLSEGIENILENEARAPEHICVKLICVCFGHPPPHLFPSTTQQLLTPTTVTLYSSYNLFIG